MSTRCQIGFYQQGEKDLKKFEALIYRHSDGYPEGVLPDIMPFLKWWQTARGVSDLEYCSARLLQYLCNEYDGRNSVFEQKVMGKNTDYTGTLGHGICCEFHGDIEYFYAIFGDGKVKVYETGFDCKTDDFVLICEANVSEDVSSMLETIKEGRAD